MPILKDDFYSRIINLDTDTFWILALLCLRGSRTAWRATEVASVFTSLKFQREDGTPFTATFISATMDKLKIEKWLDVRYGSVSMPSVPLRAVRQYLLANFPEDTAELAKLLPTVYGRNGVLARNFDEPEADEKRWLRALTGKADLVGALFLELRLLGEEEQAQTDWGIKKLCGIKVTGFTDEAATTFLPPYPDGFLEALTAPFQRGIALAFARLPQLFPSETHAQLWQLVEAHHTRDPQLLVRAAMNFLPNLPPGAGPDLWERFPDLKVVADMASRKISSLTEAPFLSTPASPNAAWHLRAVAHLSDGKRNATQLAPAFSALAYLPADVLKLNLNPAMDIREIPWWPEALNLYDYLVSSLALVWSGWEGFFLPGAKLREVIEHPNLNGSPWLRGQLYSVFARLCSDEPAAKLFRALADRMAEAHGLHYFDKLAEPPAAWEAFLTALEGGGAAASAISAGQAKQGDTRIAYIYEAQRGTLIVREQKMGKNGWSGGRKIEWLKFAEQVTEPADKCLFAALRTYNDQLATINSYSWHQQVYKVDVNQALYLLADHPHLFEDDRKRLPLQVETAEPQMLVDHNEAGDLQVRFEPSGLPEGYSIRRAGPGKLVAYHVTGETANIAKLIPAAGMIVPASATKRFEQVLPRLRRQLPVQSSTDWMDQDLPEIIGLPLPCFHLVPLGEAEHRVEIFIKPIPDGTFYFRPQEGLSRSLVATEASGRAVLVRDLTAEEAAVDTCLKACPTLDNIPAVSYDIQLANDRQTLEALRELQQLALEDRIILEYPKGQRLRLGNTVDDKQLQVQVSSGRDWFRVEAGLQLDEERIIDFELLLESLRNKDKYIKIGEDEYLTLTEGLRDRLTKMDALLHENRGSRELAPLAGSAFAEILEGLDQVVTDTAWTDNLDRMARAERFVAPPIPASFNAELRDYQQVGYEWLLRLADWGVGACLADDMGLGKTVQALAMLVERGADGPALVIAPASVIRNWRTETERFAPTLTPKLIGSAAEAEDVLSKLEANDLVLLSFGLLTYINETLLETNFHTLVVDEAQAIKNPTTQRARVVRDLNADWKVATTGTPIENNLAELWSLFRFLNPGLFGSYARFRQQYETPIVKNEDRERAEQLRRLVRPFILRRRKDDVLKELPPKTEIVRTVEPGKEEKSLYEALRRNALRDIDSADQQRRRFIVLQQLTQLRQAACHPKLLNKNSQVPSAKLEAVGETIREILDGGHKALVFSQFVGHLKLVEKWVKQEKIPYQYLDGSTPGKTRQQRVEAFQGGEGQLFLISLKAGGTGLNLTAADYVLHLDPWWNPAVEDQASDRAHRMGQLKPVTVYRFVSAGTIEEQILELHAAKRDLADQLLAGTDGAGSLSVEDVVGMLRGA